MLRVLFQNRKDAYSNWGGDTTQMEMTKKYLVRNGVLVDVSLDAEPDLVGSDYDIVHIFNIQNADFSIRQLRNAKRKGIPVVVSTIYWDMDNVTRRSAFGQLLRKAHEALPYRYLRLLPGYAATSAGKRKLRYSMMRQMLLESDLLLPNSYAEAELLSAHFDAPCIRANVVVVPNGIDDETLSANIANASGCAAFETGLPEQYVLQAGRIEPVKGQLKVIEALMGNPEIPLLFVGKGSDHSYLQRCKALGERRGNTYFHEEVPFDLMPSYYRRAKVHVLPSLRESPGLATLEAAVYGANCVVSFHGPVAEYFGGDVWYCDPEDNASIKNSILKAWQAPYNEALKTSILDKFTWREASHRTKQAYCRVLGGLCGTVLSNREVQ